MNRVILLHWKSDSLQAFVLRGTGTSLELQESIDVPLEASATETGRRLATKLEPYSPGRATLVVAVGRELLAWQHLSLPPCPDEDLPDLVRLQADYAGNGNGGSVGLDFLPLMGDQQTPRQVWTIALAAPQQARLYKILSTAELEADQIVPVVLGWPQLTSAKQGRSGSTVFVAPYGPEAAIWATVDDRVVIFRQLQLPPAHDEPFENALVGEIRRTLLAFSQQHRQTLEQTLQLVGDGSKRTVQLRESLEKDLSQEVALHQQQITFPTDKDAEAISPPLAEIAAAALAGTPPLVDLQHPRQRPAPPNRRRTYYLAAAAALALVALVGLQAYRNLQAPLDRAAEMQAQIDLLDENKETLAAAEKDAAAIRAWLGTSTNLLEELRIITQQVRPEPLDSENFPTDDDVIIGKMELRSRQFTITAYTKQNSDLQPVEYRLRDGIHRVRRGETERSDEVPGYPIKFESIVDVLSGGGNADQQGGNP